MAKTVAVTPGLSRAGLPVEFEDVDMRATLAEELALAKSKMEAPPLFMGLFLYLRLLR